MTDRQGAPGAVSAIVLAGGRSARYGGDKLAAVVGTETVLDLAIAAVASVAGEVIVAGRAIETSRPGVRSIPDPEAFGGPLLGLRAALDAVAGARAIVVGGDMPALVPGVLESMLGSLAADASIDAVILGGHEAAETGGRRQVLPIALDVERALTAARNVLEDGGRSLQRLVEELSTLELPAASWRPLDPDGMTLLDVDTAADLERARAGMAH
jgi:molybdenum cofactor guanylyltransferase